MTHLLATGRPHVCTRSLAEGCVVCDRDLDRNLRARFGLAKLLRSSIRLTE
jgi:hypothetical protein